MKRSKLIAFVLTGALALALAACGGKTDPAGSTAAAPASSDAGQPAKTTAAKGPDAKPAGDTVRIHLITMDQMDVHWVKLEKAAKAQVEKLKGEGKKIEYKWLAPEKKDNAQQIQMIETAVNDGANVIIISVNDSTACNDALQSALDAGIQIIYVDATATVKASATFATNNFAAGEQAGKEMLKRLKEANVSDGTIGIVSAQAGVQSCIDRVDGFKKAFEGSAYKMGEVQYSDGDAVKAQEQAAALINDGVVAIYGANDGATNGVGNAIKEANAGGKNILGVGFDNSSSNRALVKEGALLAFMAQNPNIMGESSIKAAVDLMSGQMLEKTEVDTGVSIVTKEDVDQFED